MLGKPFVAPSACSLCEHTLPTNYEGLETNVFDVCFSKYLTTRPAARSSSSQSKKVAKMDGDAALFDDFLFDFHDEASPFSSSADGGNSSSSDSGNNNGGETTPATEISPMSPAKFGELDLDGFTPGAPTFPIDLPPRQSSSTSTSSSASSYLHRSSHSHASSSNSGVITPDKIQLESSAATLRAQQPQQQQQQQQQQHFQPSHFFKSDPAQIQAQSHSSSKPVLSIQPPQHRQRSVSHVEPSSTVSMDIFDPLIDPALTYDGLPSATSAYSPAFSQPPSAIPSALSPPQSATSPTFSQASPEPVKQQRQAPPTKESGKPAAPKRKRTRKAAPSSPADAEKQARFLERNRNAASRCRARRKAQNDRLEARAGELEREREGLRLLAQSLVAEKAELLGRVLDLGCEDACSGVHGLGRFGGRTSEGRGTAKPPRDLLVSALGELVTGDGSSSVDGDVDMQEPVLKKEVAA